MIVRRSVDTSLLPVSMQKLAPRELRMVWSYLEGSGKINQSNKSQSQESRIFSLNDRIKIMAKIIKSHSQPNMFATEIMDVIRNFIIPNDKLSWIERKNQRQLIWAMSYLNKPVYNFAPSWSENQPALITKKDSYPILPMVSHEFSESRYDTIISALDSWNENLNAKITYLLEKKGEWSYIISQDSKMKWINQSDIDQLKWAWDYINNHRVAKFLPRPSIPDDFYSAIFSSLADMVYSRHPAEKTLFIEKMRKTWSQKKFRDSGKAKKAYYLPLTIKTRERLDWLADEYGCKPVEVLERLVSERHNELNKE